MDNSVKKIDKKTSDLICSGQVATSLAIVVKELLENSIDANAKCVEIRLKEYGKDLIEVVDNGDGILTCNFGLLTSKHNTSKLTKIDELTEIETFGFRGEALSSICALSKIIIKTRHKDDEIGTELHFDYEGNIIKKELIPRQIGTSVTIHNLFHCLPVRRKEFINNYIREFGKLEKIITCYCLGCVGVRIICTNSSGNNKQTFLTSFGHSIKSNIIEVFGQKQMSSLIEFKQIQDDNLAIDVTITGFISKCDNGMGRSTTDRQFFFVNKRPCELKKLSRLINEIYHNYNSNQYPFFLLDIKVSKNLVDINVTPDKRHLMIVNMDKIQEIVKESLTQMYGKPESCTILSLSSASSSSNLLEKWKNQSTDKRSLEKDKVDLEIESIVNNPMKVRRCRSPCDSPFKVVSNETLVEVTSVDGGGDRRIRKSLINELIDLTDEQITSKSNVQNSKNVPQDKRDKTLNFITNDPGKTSPEILTNDPGKTSPEILTNNPGKTSPEILTNNSHKTPEIINKCDSPLQIRNSKEIALNVDLKTIEENFKKFYKSKVQQTANDSCFTAEITPSQNEIAENELKQELKKDSFEKMQIIGQFNCGFIITKFDSHLFIIDQHASDERFNFEKFLDNTNFQVQKLVNPFPLELTPLNELIIKENFQTFKEFGFTFMINEQTSVGKQLLVSSVPMYKDWVGDKEDIEELTNAICESPVKIPSDYKLSRFKQLIAYKACRSSIMIGENLSKSKMKKVVSQMSQLKNPWHCAHNRPTIRHLINLDKLSTNLSQ